MNRFSAIGRAAWMAAGPASEPEVGPPQLFLTVGDPGTVAPPPGDYVWSVGYDYFIASPFTIASPLNLRETHLFLKGGATTATSTTTVQIRSDSGGSPGSILVESAPLANSSLAVATPAEITFGTEVALAAGTYWVVVFTYDGMAPGFGVDVYADSGEPAGLMGSSDGSSWSLDGPTESIIFKLYN